MADNDVQPLYMEYQTSSKDHQNGYSSYGTAPAKPHWRPSKKSMLITAGGLLVVTALAFGLIFGLSESNDTDSSGTVTSSGLGNCKALATGSFWKYLQPESYNISIALEPEHFQYNLETPSENDGQVFQAKTAITFNVSQSTSCVVLHASNLTFSSVSLEVNGDVTNICADSSACANAVAPVRNRQVNTTFDQDLVAISLGDTVLKPDTAPSLTLVYQASLGSNTSALGLHRSAPFTTCGADSTDCTAQVMVASQLERIGARRLFPSYDGPAYKATFNIAVEVSDAADMVVLSNTQEASRSQNASKVVVQFEPTPIMSTYLVAIAAGSLKEATPAGGRRRLAAQKYDVRAWAASGREANMLEARQLFTKALDFYENYFDVPQPFKRFDIVAVPGKDFSMENWGLLLFDERRALYNTDSNSTYRRFLVSDVVCHEAAHQWFGNMVTCPDWTQLFLNEGFATALEYECLEYVAPEMDMRVLQYRLTAPTSEAVGVHEGPFTLALRYAGDPLLPPMYMETDLDMDMPGVPFIYYSKAATFFRMAANFADISLRFYTPSEAGEIGIFRSAMQKMVKNNQYSTLSFYEWMKELYVTVSEGWTEKQKAGVPMQPALKNYLDRSGWYLQAKTPEEQRAVGTNGNSTVASWAYLPVYPVINTGLPGLVNSTSMPLTLLQIGGNQSRYCNWNLSDSQANEADIPNAEVSTVMNACASLIRFSLPIVLDNLTDCETKSNPYDISTVVGIDSMNGSLAAESWVANVGGERLWRTRYSESHLTNLLKEAAALTSCPKDDFEETSSEGVCCADVNDVLEASAILSDSAEFAISGQYPVTWGLAAVNSIAKAPVCSSGLGQYLLLLPAVVGLERFYPLVQNNATCSTKFRLYEGTLLQPHANKLVEILSTGNVQLGASEAARNDFLLRLSGPQILWRAALLEELAQASGRRRLEAANSTEASLAAELCTKLIQTPLWQNYVAKTSSPLNNEVATDLLPAIYVIAATTPPNCRSAIQTQYASTTLAETATDVHAGILTALKECWAGEPDYGEASRCLHAIPWSIGTAADLDGLLHWMESPLVPSTGDVTAETRVAERWQLLAKEQDALLFVASSKNPNVWSAVLSSDYTGMCELLNLMRPPVTNAERELWGETASNCDDVTRTRAVGRAAEMETLIDNGAESEICAFVDTA